MRLSTNEILPQDHSSGSFVGRVRVEGQGAGPRPVAARADGLFDLSGLAPTVSDLLDLPEAPSRIERHPGERLCSLEDALNGQMLLAPCDLQAIKACGVTFAASLLERVFEERAQGERGEAETIRSDVEAQLRGSLDQIRPGTPEAQSLKEVLIRCGTWSQYLEVGIGPDAEVFTKAQPMSAVGCGAFIGLHPASTWSVSEPEIVLAVASDGRIVGASLGNDFTLRDFEGRSALLLGRAKDNNASCAIGPFIRLFDSEFGLDDVRSAAVELSVEGPDGFRDRGTSSMAEISRDPEDLVMSVLNSSHQYPDGLMLFLGTMYVPDRDRNGSGSGFTHQPGDVVRVSSGRLGTLVNEVAHSDSLPPWTDGARALMRSLADRGLL
jgi:fumarylacetoacetate (FAA) hydrolase family protein